MVVLGVVYYAKLCSFCDLFALNALLDIAECRVDWHNSLVAGIRLVTSSSTSCCAVESNNIGQVVHTSVLHSLQAV